MTTTHTYKPAAVGEVRGPWHSSPGSKLPWQAACYGPNGWIFNHAKSADLALDGARRTAEQLATERRAA